MLKREQRLFSSSRSEDGRTPFERDRDRILYTAQFRRLSGVTQVTSPAELHSFHNRLTHTLEVAQISRRISERLLRRGEVTREEIDPDVCEAAAFAHDLGHPPFGHNGEKTLDAASRGKDPDCTLSEWDDDGYEGNAQSLRIITKLAVRGPGHPGLDLTAATIRASIKYPWLRTASGKKSSKFGVYVTEEETFEKVFKGLSPDQQTLEAQVMDWADDIAYSIHDLYDFVLAGLMPLHRLTTATGDELRDLLSKNSKVANVPSDVYETVVTGLRLLPVPELGVTSRSSSPLVGELKEWVSALIARFADHQIQVDRSGGILNLKKLGTVEQEVTVLKALTYHYAIGSPGLAVRQNGEKAILRGLLKILLDDAKSDQRLMSAEARERLQQEARPMRTVMDTISSMTDSQAMSIYHKLTGISLASVLDVTTPSVL